jgi:hypothetical protein
MSNPCRAMIAQLTAALQQRVFLDPEIDGNHLPRLAEELLAQPEPPELTDQEITKAASEALDSYQYNTELPYFLEEHASEYEPIMLAFRAAIAADRARRHPQQSATMSASTGEA